MHAKFQELWPRKKGLSNKIEKGIDFDLVSPSIVKTARVKLLHGYMYTFLIQLAQPISSLLFLSLSHPPLSLCYISTVANNVDLASKPI